jgi:hypothetical protein
MRGVVDEVKYAVPPQPSANRVSQNPPPFDVTAVWYLHRRPRFQKHTVAVTTVFIVPGLTNIKRFRIRERNELPHVFQELDLGQVVNSVDGVAKAPNDVDELQNATRVKVIFVNDPPGRQGQQAPVRVSLPT